MKQTMKEKIKAIDWNKYSGHTFEEILEFVDRKLDPYKDKDDYKD